MESVVLEHIPFRIDPEDLGKKLHLKVTGQQMREVLSLGEEGERIGKPKATYHLSFIEEKGDDLVVIEGARFRSHILRVNLDQAQRVFP